MTQSSTRKSREQDTRKPRRSETAIVSEKHTGSENKKKVRAKTQTDIVLPRYVLIAVVVILSLFGLMMVYSSSSVRAFFFYEGDSMYYLKRQVGWVLASFIIAFLIAKIDYQKFRGVLAWIPWALSMVLLLATVFMGTVGDLGAQRWLYIGPIGLQPSEFAKLTVIILLASFVCDWHEKRTETKWFLLKAASVLGSTLILVMLQPDLGTSILLVVISITLMFLGGVPFRWLGGLAIFGAGGALVLAIIEPYRLKRLLAINPWTDKLGDGWQVVNSLLAFGSGKIIGVGLGLSRQKYMYLPQAHTDFIFAIIGEELGLLGAIFTISLFLVFAWSGFQVARMANDRFGRLIAGSATVAIIAQAFVNIMCTIGMLPVTGKPLPFISYGGSSMLATFLAVGMILSVSLHSGGLTRSEKNRSKMKVVESGGTDEHNTQRRRNSGARISSYSRS